ncbi:hypothetical protein VAR608DRAFT_0651 [Variovorax sp. HW608]|nr:hypothetical protein VAR608DRAFT_0651 [Variovorax sp. HW608]
MFGWFNRRRTPASGPDFRHVDSRAKAEALHAKGELRKLLLLPAAFGGEDIPPNVVYVPAFALGLKEQLDQGIVRQLVRDGKATRYAATPEYEGKSVIPSQIRVAATEPGHFEGTISIWGKAAEKRPSAASQIQDPTWPAFRLSSASVESMGPEDLVRAFISDYDAWNRYSHLMSERDAIAGIDAAEAAYAELSRKYCPPGQVHQPISFGSDSSHDSEREAIVDVATTDDASLVRTRHTKKVGSLVMARDHEFHLKRADGRWYLTSLLYVDEDGKYEGL